MYEWQNNFSESDFNETKVLRIWEKKQAHTYLKKKEGSLFEVSKRSIDINLIPLIQEYPNVNFIFFIPPYSILTYKNIEVKQNLNEYLLTEEYIYQEFSKYKNVQIHNFKYAKKVSYNLNNYKDLTHYHASINKWILKHIDKKTYLIDLNNKQKYMKDNKEFKSKIKSYIVYKGNNDAL